MFILIEKSSQTLPNFFLQKSEPKLASQRKKKIWKYQEEAFGFSPRAKKKLENFLIPILAREAGCVRKRKERKKWRGKSLGRVRIPSRKPRKKFENFWNPFWPSGRLWGKEKRKIKSEVVRHRGVAEPCGEPTKWPKEILVPLGEWWGRLWWPRRKEELLCPNPSLEPRYLL